MDNNDKRLQQMFISQCNICNLAPAMRVCNKSTSLCKFSVGLDYWNCRCEDDCVRHKSEMFCVRCDTDRPPLMMTRLDESYIKVIVQKD